MMEAPNLTPYQYAKAVGNGMTEREAAAQLAAAEVEAAYLKAISTGTHKTRQTLIIAALAYFNALPLPKMSRRVTEKFNKYVKPYADMLRAECEAKSREL